jgi:hypothetical protein
MYVLNLAYNAYLGQPDSSRGQRRDVRAVRSERGAARAAREGAPGVVEDPLAVLSAGEGGVVEDCVDVQYPHAVGSRQPVLQI